MIDSAALVRIGAEGVLLAPALLSDVQNIHCESDGKFCFRYSSVIKFEVYSWSKWVNLPLEMAFGKACRQVLKRSSSRERRPGTVFENKSVRLAINGLQVV